MVNLNGQVGEREKKDKRGKKQWKKNGKLMLCNKAPPILRGDHHHFFVQMAARLPMLPLPDEHTWGSSHTKKRVRFVFLSKQVGVRRFATIFGFIEGSWSQDTVAKLPKQKCPTSAFYSINGELRIQEKWWCVLSPSHLLKRKEWMVKIYVEGCCVRNCPAGGLEEDERTEEAAE